MTPDAEFLRRYAELVVGFAANVQPGQIVELRSALGREPLTRAIGESCYRHGARFVDLLYFDPYLKRARVEHADPETLDFVPEWHRQRVLGYGHERGARIAVGGLVGQGLLDGLPPDRVARDRWPFIREYHTVIDEQTTNWAGATVRRPTGRPPSSRTRSRTRVSSGSGRRSRSRAGSTRTTPSPPGASGSPSETARRRR